MKNIVIMGFKACGKSWVGRDLAKKLEREFIDLDDVIRDLYKQEFGEQLSCREIHQKHGAEKFRSLEAKAVEQVSQKSDCVIALGGGTIAYSANVDLLKGSGIIVYLKDSAENLLERIKKRGIPTFLDPTDLEGSMKRELARREPLYEKYADIIVSSAGLSIDGIVEKIIGALK